MAVTLQVAPSAAREWLHETRLHALLVRERLRSDRTGASFSLLVLDWPAAARTGADLDALRRGLAARLRCTDEYGWLDAGRVGVVLPETDAHSAHVVARAIAGACPAALLPLTWEVHSYPRQESGGGAVPRRARREAPPASPAQPMEPLFVRPMPRWKRVLDIAGASVGLIVSLPILGAAIALVKIVSPGPAIFRQRRAGLGGASFTIYKLRTMWPDADERKGEVLHRNALDGPGFKLARDPRTIPFGRLLRSTSIDELPQFWNVLRGDMSLVGPRPLPCEESDQCATWQRKRLDVTPGMTGIWQVSGRSEVPFARWVRMDLKYIRRRSVGLDLKLILKTIPALVRRKGAY